tara:strand:- start:33787 stop:34587 length:801 start_codon:yes stop_codon:yes gene_type:complete
MSDFSSNENKGMMWQLLYEQGAFNNISNTYINNIKGDFDKIVNVISTKTELDLTNKNKLLLTEIVKYLEQYKENSTHITRPLEEVQIKMDKELKEKEKEFIELIKRPSPAEIDFTEKIDEPLKETSINSMLNKMIAEREIEINNIIPPPPEKKEINNKKNSEERNNVNIMISDENNTNIDDNKPVKKLTNDFFKNLSKSNVNENNNKVVSFNEDYNDDGEYENDRYNSQIVYSNNNIMELLKKMLNNQEVILSNQKKIMQKIFLTD